jgi:hypothetical protein
MAYDALKASRPEGADREYVRILHLAAHETESGVEDALRILMAREQAPTAEAVEELVRSGRRLPPPTEVVVEPVDLASYDELFEYGDFECHEVLA